MAPPVVLLAHQRFFVTEAVARVTAKGHGGADREVLAVTESVDWNSRVKAGVGIYGNTYE